MSQRKCNSDHCHLLTLNGRIWDLAAKVHWKRLHLVWQHEAGGMECVYKYTQWPLWATRDTLGWSQLPGRQEKIIYTLLGMPSCGRVHTPPSLLKGDVCRSVTGQRDQRDVSLSPAYVFKGSPEMRLASGRWMTGSICKWTQVRSLQDGLPSESKTGWYLIAQFRNPDTIRQMIHR
jgi:hypothetical protein